MYYYDEAGTDVSKYVRDQPYYSVAEVLQCVEELLGDSQPAKVLFEALVFYRDEVPRSNKISLFNLIEVVFAMSKGWGVQLRIYMFVILANHLYALVSAIFLFADLALTAICCIDAKRAASPRPAQWER